MKSFKIETKNLILRHLNLDDLDGMFELDSNPIVHKYLGNNPHKSIEQSKKDIEFNINQYAERGIARWATIEKSSGEFIGWSGLRLNSDITYNNTTNYYDVGYRFIPRYWGNGYATEASLAALNYFFIRMKKDLLCGIAETENIASNRVLQKIGLQHINNFEADGVSTEWYELKREDYKKWIQKIKARAYYLKNKETIQTYNRERYQKNEAYKVATLNRAKSRYHQDLDYRDKTIERAKLRYKKNKNG